MKPFPWLRELIWWWGIGVVVYGIGYLATGHFVLTDLLVNPTMFWIINWLGYHQCVEVHRDV